MQAVLLAPFKRDTQGLIRKHQTGLQTSQAPTPVAKNRARVDIFSRVSHRTGFGNALDRLSRSPKRLAPTGSGRSLDRPGARTPGLRRVGRTVLPNTTGNVAALALSPAVRSVIVRECVSGSLARSKEWRGDTRVYSSSKWVDADGIFLDRARV